VRAVVGDGQGQGTIRNDDSAPTVSLSINDVSVVEGNSGTTDAVFTVSLSGPTTKTVKVDYSAPDGFPTQHLGAFGTFTFAPGETAKSFTIKVVGDTVFESDQRYEVRLSNAANATLADAVGILTILNDEAPPTLSINDVSITEGDSGTKDLVFTVRLSTASERTVSFQYFTSPGTADENVDYFRVNGAMLMVEGQTVRAVSVPIQGDTVGEADEFFRVTILNPSEATISKAVGIGTILNDDPPPPGGIPTPTPTPAPTPVPQIIDFTDFSYFVGEGDGAAGITVRRTGDASGPASVDYATSNGTASDRSDFTTAVGTLRFAPGETSKSFTVFITDDALAEGQEIAALTLSNASGGRTIGTTGTASLAIRDNDPANGPNPARTATFDPAFFARQHYVDFFNREPDAAGLAFWTGQLTGCGADPQCLELKRQNVSAAFFLSIEFQQTGYYVYRFHQAAFNTGERLRLREFLPDTQEIGRGVAVGQGDWQAQLERNKQAYADAFIARQALLEKYPAGLPAAQFVDALNSNTGGSLSQAERDDLAARLGAGALTRAQVLRAVAEDADFRQREFNRAFVLMQYFGYLRRNPNDAPEPTLDFSGLNFWLQKLTNHGGNFVSAEMVKAFITSEEYKQRFGP
jgi:hypothetical protein